MIPAGINGSYGNGTVFKLEPNGTESVLRAFTGGSDGGSLEAGLIADGTGNLYGTGAAIDGQGRYRTIMGSDPLPAPGPRILPLSWRPCSELLWIVKVKLHHGDLPENVDFGAAVAIDTETLGLNPFRDRLCLVQLSAGDDTCHAVQFGPGDTHAPNLKRLLADTSVIKLFHFARFDLATLKRHLGVTTAPAYCTKIASRLARTYTDKHGLKDLVRDLLGVDLSKEQQSSDWGAERLSEKQLAYAANDVAYLHRLRTALDAMLAREGRSAHAQACFDFLPARADLDLAGWADTDIFAH
ncbi:MAG TPA: ribonuclease D [Rhizomicrobium sp.]|nr:ribonuclease D [Rhizomicrobium sp.]